MILYQINCARTSFYSVLLALLYSVVFLKVDAKPQTNPCLVLKLPLCSINPNFANGGNPFASPFEEEGQRPAVEQSRRQQGNKVKSSQQSSSSSLSSQDLAVSDLLDKFLKSTGSDIAVKSAPPANVPAPTSAPGPLSINGKVRSDRRCGEEFPLSDFSKSECDPMGVNYCCSKWGYCGPGAEHCECPECVDYRNENSPDVPEFVGKTRTDRRCGSEHPMPDGSPSQCDPNGDNPCCSKWGFCGPDAEHCECEECVDYTKGNLTESLSSCEDEELCTFIPGSACDEESINRKCPKKCNTCPVLTAFGASDLRKVRSDRRCGKEFPLKDGTPSECDGTSEVAPCCSEWGFCGPNADHCACDKCVDYRTADQRAANDFVGKARNDRRCGKEFPLPGNQGLPSECDPKSENFCCSKWGFCGFDAEHCDCQECVNYKLIEVDSEQSFSVPTATSVPPRKRPTATFPTLEPIRRPTTKSSSSFRTRGSSSAGTNSGQNPISSSSFRTRGSSSAGTNPVQDTISSSNFRTRGSSSAGTNPVQDTISSSNFRTRGSSSAGTNPAQDTISSSNFRTSGSSSAGTNPVQDTVSSSSFRTRGSSSSGTNQGQNTRSSSNFRTRGSSSAETKPVQNTRSSSSFSTSESSSSGTNPGQNTKSRGASRLRDRFISRTRKRTTTTTTTPRPKSFNEYEEYVYYDY